MELIIVIFFVGLYLLADIRYWQPKEARKKYEDARAYYPYMDENDLIKMVNKNYPDD